MSEKNFVDGEASESECEFEDQLMAASTNAGIGMAVDGEATESDEEIITFSKNYGPDATNASYQNHPKGPTVGSSILQKKLCESNSSLWKHIAHLIQSASCSASKDLLHTDQLLLKSQVTLQSASQSLKTTNEVSNEILVKMRNVATANFLPSIKI